ncbi:hypothetical protein JP28_01170 [Gallibacterium anatis]|uniref:Hemophilus-specific protein n=1 Tax=Gallibacterium anatis 12656/12 TaxID=1195244 RepID=U1GYP4_9PAST|nr:hypothetical protein [Gallibacterium anatis]ERF77618.1 hypothetical protein N561_10635 [Gallibacterium anatis 12656/12]KGQ25091.1 hypothetical protein JP31_07835 [Gallibacterium anatis]KGQ26496.1 hypothetical protein JP27_07040 [Gallibacterium anatis]KGQ45380.1 hypothetical protein JP28_01170 [Gallibacterium anatis]KGQ50730.1 hypothetical protein IO46_08815 [Gallibacterium anatis]
MKTKKARKFLTSLLIGMLIFLTIFLLSIVLITYLPGPDLTTWLQETAIYWLIWRLFLNSLVGVLLYQIYRYRILPGKAIGLIVLICLVTEGLNVLYRL